VRPALEAAIFAELQEERGSVGSTLLRAAAFADMAKARVSRLASGQVDICINNYLCMFSLQLCKCGKVAAVNSR
jgi:hypothetical protein